MIEKHVTSPEISKKLKVLGFNKKSLFAWLYNIESEEYEAWYYPGDEDGLSEVECKAYLATELLEWIESKENIISPSLIDVKEFLDDKTSRCDSLAKIVIYILEEIKK